MIAQTTSLVQVAVEADCQTSLGAIFEDSLVSDSPADVLVNFVENYCTKAADAYLESKWSISRTFHRFIVNLRKELLEILKSHCLILSAIVKDYIVNVLFLF